LRPKLFIIPTHGHRFRIEKKEIVKKMAFLLHQLLSESAVKYPNKEAIIFKDQRMTYSELERESSKLAYSLSEIGIGRGERVGIHMSRCINSIVGAFGILKAGATYVPVDPMCPPSRLSYIINKGAIKVLLTSREKLTNIERAFPESSPVETILIMNGLKPGSGSPGFTKWIDWQEIRESARGETPRTNTVDSDLAYILFTSGSTGNPKGVMISHLNSLTFVNSAHDFFEIKMDDRFSNICPLHFDMSVFDLFVAFKAGASVVIVPESISIFPSRLAEFIDKNKISVWNSVPSALSLLANLTNLDHYDFSSLRLILFAGEVFPIKHLRRLQKSIPGARFYNIYGQTEANSSTYYWVEQVPSDDAALLPIGKPFPNFEVFALNENGKRVSEAGEKGELYVRASSVALGYLGDVEKTKECFVKNPLKPDLSERVYRTGDLVQLRTDGNFIFLGRKDHMIKSRGYRIEIGEIETVLRNHPGIMNAVVIPIPDELIGNRIAAVIVPVKKGTIGKEDIIRDCATQLPKYMIPEIMEFRDSLTMTSSGKVDRESYTELFREELKSFTK
jgi:amino acid adenylation domain-containing protein